MDHAPSTTGLRAQALSVSFAGVHALRAVDLAVPRGAVTGLIGPNGAGKTTLVNALTGFVAPSRGRVALDGADLTGQPPEAYRRAGIARTFQGGRLFRQLSVHDNLQAAGVGLGLGRAQARREAERLLDWMGLQPLAHHPAGALPYTDERRVGIARAMVGTPAYLLLDEPAAGMSEHEATELQALIARLAGECGCGVLLIEHNVRLVLGCCAQVVVMDAGAVIEHGSAETIRHSERVRHAYMGTAADDAADPLEETECTP